MKYASKDAMTDRAIGVYMDRYKKRRSLKQMGRAALPILRAICVRNA